MAGRPLLAVGTVHASMMNGRVSRASVVPDRSRRASHTAAKRSALMTRIIFGIMVVVLVGTSGVAHAQDRVRLEVVPGFLFATEEFATSDLGRGFGAGANVSVRVLPRLAPYVGWDWRRLSSDDLFVGSEVDVEETGYTFGLRYEHPLTRGASALMVRAGGTYSHIEIENVFGSLLADSGHGFGWEAATGVMLPLGARWHMTPGVRFRSLSRDMDLDGVQAPVRLRYLAAEVGFSRSF
jgi:hypothetical protein